LVIRGKRHGFRWGRRCCGERYGKGGAQERADSCRSSSSSSPRNNSNLHLRLAALPVHFAGREVVWDSSARDADVGAGAGSGSSGEGALAIGGGLLPPSETELGAARVLTGESLFSALADGGSSDCRALIWWRWRQDHGDIGGNSASWRPE
jgi:hypothetical protein